jgi:peptide/nickel transport system substrate-binding protein
MAKRAFLGVLILILAASLLVACTNRSQTSSTPATTSTAQPITSTISVTNSTSATQANWWDKFGTPQYGGQFIQALSSLDGQFDLLNPMGTSNDLWFSLQLFEADWTLNPDIYHTVNTFVPEKYAVGFAAESWEMTDSRTFTFRLHQGIHWQNKAPVNGREFVAADVAFHFNRSMGPGSTMAGMLSNWESVTASDKYTVVVKFKNPCPGTAFQSVIAVSNLYEAPEFVALAPTSNVTPTENAGSPAGGGPPGPPVIDQSSPLQDWHNAVGAGPWILTDFVSSSSMTYVKNPNYFGKDPRYPQNQTPYADTLKSICIKDISTQQAAMRTGKIDILGVWPTALDWQQAKKMAASNPELVEGTPFVPDYGGVAFVQDKAPFTDIRVREAMNMAIDRQNIGKSYYGGLSEGNPVGIITPAYKGWAYDYADWPQSTKDKYAYNPTKARQLLADAGYPNGFKTNLVTASSGMGGGDLGLFQIIKANLNDIGVDMEIILMDSAAIEDYLRNGKADQLVGQGGGMSWGPSRCIDEFYSKGPDAAMFHVNDPAYDALREKFFSAGSEDQAAVAMQAADKYIVERVWGVWVQGAGTYTFMQPYVKGWDSRAPLDWRRLWVDQDQKKSMGR